MTEQVDEKEAPGALDVAFQALPPLGSQEYLEHIRTVATSDLPPEVLVRAFRQLPADSAASRATLERLFRRRDERWDYLGSLVAYARRQARRSKRDERPDLLQDALTGILKVLPTPRGAYAERAWHSFCRRELSNAWRERHGRRGERFPKEEPIGSGRTDDGADPLAEITIAPPWHATVAENSTSTIEAVARGALREIQDDFVRAVADAAWFKTARPRVSGKLTEGTDPPLTALFPKKSRFQIMRALRHADSQLAATLLADPDIEWTDDLRALLEKLTGGAARAAALRSER